MPRSSTETAIASLIGEYEPALASELRALFPRGYELVYDNYNALVFAISTSERTPDCLLSIVEYPRWVTLFFADGKGLADPKKLLQGSGSLRAAPKLSTVLKSVAKTRRPRRPS